MKKRLTKILATILSFVMLLSVVSITASAAIIDSGTCGDNLTWTLDDNGILTISGTGYMSTHYKGTPWNSYLKNIKKVIISKGVTSIGSCAFEACTALVSITIPEGVREIDSSAISDCSSLTSITIPEGVKKIGEFAFMNDCSLEEIIIPDSVKTVGYAAFAGCTNLKKVVISEGMSSIAMGMFERCIALETIYIPESVTKIDGSAFWDCNSLKEIFYGGSKEQWKKIDIVDFNNEILSKAIIHYDVCRHINTEEVSAIEATQEDVGYTAGVYCNDCKKYISGHKEIPVLTVVMGDLDGDGVIKAADARIALRASVGLEALEEAKKKAADTDGDGAIKAADARLILRASVGLENPKSWLKK